MSNLTSSLRRVLLAAVEDYDWLVRSLAYDQLATLKTSPTGPTSRCALRSELARNALITPTVADFVTSARKLDEQDDPDLFETVFGWLKAKLVSTLPDTEWNTARYHLDSTPELFGETIEIPGRPGTFVIQLAKDTFELHRDRDIWPAANTVFAWTIAKRLRALKPRTLVLVCAPVSPDVIASLVRPLEPGEVLMGPVVFGFRLYESAPASPPG